MKRITFVITLAAIVAIAIPGCTTAEYNPETHLLKYRNGLFEKKVAKIQAEFPDGAKLNIEGYQSTASDLITAGANAAAVGAAAFAKKAVVP